MSFKVFNWWGIFKAMLLFCGLFVTTAGAMFTATGWFLEKVIYREMDDRKASIAQLNADLKDLSGTITGQIAEIGKSITSVDQNIQLVDRKIDETANRLSNDIVNKNSTQNQIFTELEASYKVLNSAVTSIRSDMNRSSEQTEKTIADLSDDINEDISELETETKEATQKVEDSISEISEADLKLQVLEEMLSLGITNAAVQQAILSVMIRNAQSKHPLNTVASLLQIKSENTPNQFFKDLQEIYTADTREAMLIAHDELTEERTVEFFLDVQEIKDSLPPDMAAAHKSSADGDVAIDKIREQPKTIVGVCSEMIDVRDTACYSYFRKRALSLSKEGVSTGVRISEAAIKAIENKYTDDIRLSMDEQ